MNTYTSIEAMQALEKGRSPLRPLAQAAKEFLKRYMKNLGFLDGWRGFYLSLFMVFYRIATAAKLQELKAVGRENGSNHGIARKQKRFLEPMVSPHPLPLPELPAGSWSIST